MCRKTIRRALNSDNRVKGKYIVIDTVKKIMLSIVLSISFMNLHRLKGFQDRIPLRGIGFL